MNFMTHTFTNSITKLASLCPRVFDLCQTIKLTRKKQ